MAEKDLEAHDIEQKVHDLAVAMKEIRHRQADRDDVVVEMKQAKASRLEMLADDLQEVVKQIPKDDERFDIALVKAETPRLWIDMTSFVRMGRDGRHYEFVKDTRLGRTILVNTDNRGKMGEAITNYIAERVLERERELEGEWVSLRDKNTENADVAQSDQTTAFADSEDAKAKPAAKGISLLSAFIWFLLGLVIGLCVLATALVFDQFQPLMQWIAGLGG